MLNYRLHGELNDSPPLIVLHGLLGSLDNWNSVARQRAAKQTVLAIDLRNHGDSPHVEGMSYQQMVADIIELLDHLQLPVCDLMGHSMGGKVAMLLALAHPQRIQRLLIVDIAPKEYPPRHQNLLQAMTSLPLATLTSRKQADEWLSHAVKHPLDRGFLLKNLKRNAQTGFHWQCNLSEIARHYLKISAFPVPEQQFSAATCFIRGGQSDYVQDTDWEQIQHYFPTASLVTLAEAGHLPHVQVPTLFLEQLEAFLD